VAPRRLAYLDQASTPRDLVVPAGSKLRALDRDRKGEHAIWINDQWRICFVWRDRNAEEAELSTMTDEDRKLYTRDEALALSLDDVAPGPTLPPLTPGEVLLEEFMRPLGLTARALAAEMGVPGNRVSSIVNGSRAITAHTALLLAQRFGTSAELWMGLQVAHDLAVARENWPSDRTAQTRRELLAESRRAGVGGTITPRPGG
jgi:antitoxin HigA-1